MIWRSGFPKCAPAPLPDAGLREALEKIIICYERNVGRQDEKLADIPIIARRALSLSRPDRG